jgi:hypothetical protein
VENSLTWLPGETINCGLSDTNSGSQYESELERLKEWMHRLVSDMQAAVLGRISGIEETIQSLSVRVAKLEEDAARNQPAESPATGGSHQSHSDIRIRKTPTELQASYSRY